MVETVPIHMPSRLLVRAFLPTNQCALLQFPDGAEALSLRANTGDASITTLVVSHESRVFDDILRIHVEEGPRLGLTRLRTNLRPGPR